MEHDQDEAGTTRRAGQSRPEPPSPRHEEPIIATQSGAADTSGDTPTKRATIQLGSVAVGVVFLLVGVAGFIPGITRNYSEMTFASHHSGAHLLWVFQVSVLHNLVHLLFGVAGILFARTPLSARNYLLFGGLAYGAFFLYGILIQDQSMANFVPFNDADDFLHFVLAAGMIALSFLLDRGPAWRQALLEHKVDI